MKEPINIQILPDPVSCSVCDRTHDCRGGETIRDEDSMSQLRETLKAHAVIEVHLDTLVPVDIVTTTPCVRCANPGGSCQCLI